MEVNTLEDCEDIRRVLVVPGSEEFQPPKESYIKTRQMRILKLKGSSAEGKKVRSITFNILFMAFPLTSHVLFIIFPFKK